MGLWQDAVDAIMLEAQCVSSPLHPSPLSLTSRASVAPSHLVPDGLSRTVGACVQEPERCADLRKELSAERRAKTELGRGLAELRSKERAWRKERQVSLTIACHALPR